MDLESIKQSVKQLTKTDFVRLYLQINKDFDEMKSEHPKNVTQLIYNVKNPEKVKARVYAYRQAKKTSPH